MKKKEFKRKISKVAKSSIKHLNRQIPPDAHTPMYNFHKYWSRKTWNVVGEFIETYCPENGIVFDPFGGSGVSALEALKIGRKAIISDISPIATEIIRLTIKQVSLIKLQEAFERVEKNVKKKILKLYQTQCRKCKNEFPFDCAIWIQDKCIEIRYKSCPHCGDERRSDTSLLKKDKELLNTIVNHQIKEWYPKNPLYHINGNPFKEKQQYESLDELFTKRNLYALAILMEAIEQESNRDLKAFLKIGFSSMVHLCSKMNPISEAGHFTPFSSAWTQHSYWYPSGPYMEQNVWYKFQSSILGHQGLLKAKQESNKYYEKIKFAKDFTDVINGKADVFIYTGSCLDLMKKMQKLYREEACVDYIFTDPPYDSSIQYGELSYLWVAWLKKDKGYLEMIDANEIIHNEKQNKDFEVYTSLLKQSFGSMFDVLKPDKYLTLTFHNPTFKVRNSTISCGTQAGFELEKIHHQELARPSAKSLLQPFGSAQGDFYLRFHKPLLDEGNGIPDKIDELRFKTIVVETTKKILAQRGEPTPYTIIINAIDPELAKNGYFSELKTGLTIENVLKDHLEKEFVLIDVKIGGASGKIWWFKNPNLVPHLEKIPLTERVEQTVLRELQSKGSVTFTDIWEAVSEEFPNSLTSDQSSIKDALVDYARPVKGGFWLIKQNFRPGFVEKEHTTIIAILAEIGKKRGYEINIGKIEQNHEIDSPLLLKKGKLKQFMENIDLRKLKEIQNPNIVGDIDLLWIENDKVQMAFEVECTTSMTSALQRGSNLKNDIKKVMLIPGAREEQFKRKMKSPMFYETFTTYNWSIITFELLYKAWQKDKTKAVIEDLFDRYSIIKPITYKNKDENQLNIFEEYSKQLNLNE